MTAVSLPPRSIKDRSIYVYLSSREMVRDWKDRASKAGLSISRFVIEHVSNSLRQEDGEGGYKSRAELIRELGATDKELGKLTRENEVLRLALERVEDELRRYRAEPFLERDFRGVRKYDRQLIDLLKKGREIDSDHLLHRLRVDPKETDLVKAVSNQLGNLEAYGLIKKTRRGWRWAGE